MFCICCLSMPPSLFLSVSSSSDCSTSECLPLLPLENKILKAGGLHQGLSAQPWLSWPHPHPSGTSSAHCPAGVLPQSHHGHLAWSKGQVHPDIHLNPLGKSPCEIYQRFKKNQQQTSPNQQTKSSISQLGVFRVSCSAALG